MRTNQYKVSVYRDGSNVTDSNAMRELHNLFGVGYYHVYDDSMIIEMMDEINDRDIEALQRIMNNRGFRFEYSEFDR